MREATIADDGALDERKKKAKRKKKTKDHMVPFVRLNDVMAGVKQEPNSSYQELPRSSFASMDPIEISSDDDDWMVAMKKKKKKSKRCHPKKSKKGRKDDEKLLLNNGSDQFNALIAYDRATMTSIRVADTENENGYLMSTMKEERQESPIPPHLIEIKHENESPVYEEEGAGVSEFYEKCKQIMPKVEREQDLRLAESAATPDSSLNTDLPLVKVKSKKSKHKTCHKSRKHRSNKDKVRDILSSGSLLQDELPPVPFNDKRNHISGVYLSSINATENEVELETSPSEVVKQEQELATLDELGKQSEVTITKVDSLTKSNKLSIPLASPISLQYNDEIIANDLRKIKEKSIHSLDGDSTSNVSSWFKPANRNYLTSPFNAVESVGEANIPKSQLVTFLTVKDGQMETVTSPSAAASSVSKEKTPNQLPSAGKKEELWKTTKSRELNTNSLLTPTKKKLSKLLQLITGT